MRRAGPLLFLAAWLAGTAGLAQSLPTLAAPVNDFAGLLDAGSLQELDRRIRALESRTRDAVAVVTVESIAPFDSIEEYAVKLFERAGVGQRDRDNGLLVVVAKQERQVRIEVGYDLEEFVTDGFAGEVIREQMIPAFRAGEYGAGLLAGTTRVIARIAERRGVTLEDVPAAEATQRRSGAGAAAFVPVVIIVLFIILAVARSKRPRYRGRWPPWGGFGGPFGGVGGGFGGFGRGGGGFGGFGGGGFGGFGGGRSGGGGASGRW